MTRNIYREYDDLDNFEKEIAELIGVWPDGWTYHGDTDLDYGANVWFSHTPSEDMPRGQPLTWDELSTLNAEYGIIHVESNSHGETGSRLCVRLDDV